MIGVVQIPYAWSGVDCFRSLFYFVPQDSHSQAGLASVVLIPLLCYSFILYFCFSTWRAQKQCYRSDPSQKVTTTHTS